MKIIKKLIKKLVETDNAIYDLSNIKDFVGDAKQVRDMRVSFLEEKRSELIELLSYIE